MLVKQGFCCLLNDEEFSQICTDVYWQHWQFIRSSGAAWHGPVRNSPNTDNMFLHFSFHQLLMFTLFDLQLEYPVVCWCASKKILIHVHAVMFVRWLSIIKQSVSAEKTVGRRLSREKETHRSVNVSCVLDTVSVRLYFNHSVKQCCDLSVCLSLAPNSATVHFRGIVTQDH